MENNNSKIVITERVFTSLKKPDTLNISNEFRDLFLSPSKNPEILDVPIITFRIIFKIMVDLRNVTYSKKEDTRNIRQLSLFDEAMRTKNNTYSMFNYKIKDLDPHRNTSNIKKSLEFLEQYKKGWYDQTNSAGKKITSYGGLVSQPSYSNGEVSFLVSSYWMEKIVELNQFNETLYDTLLHLKEPKHLLFYLWVLGLKPEGTKTHYKTINQSFNYNYKSARELYTNFLVPLKTKLNKNSGLSFGAGVKGDYINIKKVPLVQVENLDQKTITNLMIRQKVKYIKERHSLSDNCLKSLTLYLNISGNYNAVNEAYKIFVKDCRTSKIKASNVVNEEFKKSFQSHLLNMGKDKIWKSL